MLDLTLEGMRGDEVASFGKETLSWEIPALVEVIKRHLSKVRYFCGFKLPVYAQMSPARFSGLAFSQLLPLL